MSTPPYTIGFANAADALSFSAAVRDSIIAAADAMPAVNLLVRDNDFNTERALANAHEFAEKNVDLVIMYHIDERAGPEIEVILRKRAIPIISVELPIPMTTFFGIDNKGAGAQAGVALGEWINANWGGAVDKLLVLTDYRYTTVIRQRFESALDGLATQINFVRDDVMYIHSGNDRQVAQDNTLPVMQAWGEIARVGMIAANDDVALGGIEAAEALGIAEHVAVTSFGATLAHEEFSKPASRLVASVAFYPEKYGQPLLELALRILAGERVPPFNLLKPVCLTKENFHQEA